MGSNLTLLVRAWLRDWYLYADVLKSSPVGGGVESRPVGFSFKCARSVAQLCFEFLSV